MKQYVLPIFIGILGTFLICGATPQTLTGKSQNSIEKPDLIESVTPTLPKALRQSERELQVLVEFTITLDGTVRDVQVVHSESATLNSSVVSAIQQWKFHPKRINGRAVATRVRMPIRFEWNTSG